jgi:LPXTG-site transpeptidase (sortase) family protein
MLLSRRNLRAAHWMTLVGGGCLLAWPGWVWVESAYAQRSGERQLAGSARADRETIVAPGSKPSGGRRPARGSVLGRFQIPKLNLSYVLLEGTDSRTLDKSIGHVEGSSLVGESGNIGIAGHRNTHFRKLEWIRRGDEVVLSSAAGAEYRYRVEWARLYHPTDMEVLDPAHGPAITLITCFPFEYVGSAPLRFVVRALPEESSRILLNPPPATARN